MPLKTQPHTRQLADNLDEPHHAAILKCIEYGVYDECVVVLSKIIFYLLQDGCNPPIATYKPFQHITNSEVSPGSHQRTTSQVELSRVDDST